MSRLFARRKGRHHRRHFSSHGSSTGWSGLAQMVPAQRSEPFTRPRVTPLALCAPVAAEELVPFKPYPHPYDSPKDAA
ncbi:hypothetical protein ABZ897_00470 [Nonomuraea sp. NPDC046802]|uniref:hypothetical protein n=1 Tax=Nonomuraea sp. NPDC046802 TaxID=3154919 RepID=UPI003405D0CA